MVNLQVKKLGAIFNDLIKTHVLTERNNFLKWGIKIPQIIQSSMYSPMTICLQEYEDTIEGEKKTCRDFFF